MKVQTLFVCVLVLLAPKDHFEKLLLTSTDFEKQTLPKLNYCVCLSHEVSQICNPKPGINTISQIECLLSDKQSDVEEQRASQN